MKKITILVPAYNEEEVIPLFIEECDKEINKIDDVRFAYLFIDDGSTDNTLNILMQKSKKDDRIKFVSFSRNFGKEIALMAGIDNISKDSDAIVIMDADLQDPPSYIKIMVEEWRKGFQDVYARRVSREGESFMKKWTSVCYYRILAFLSSIPIQVDTGDFRLLDRIAYESIRDFREIERYSKGIFSLIGFKKKEVIFHRKERKAGQTKWNYINLINLAIDGITSFTVTPLRLSTFFGLITSFFAFGYMAKVIFDRIVYGEDVAGYPSIIVLITFIGGIQLLSLGIIGEYIGKIFKETKNRPPYIVNQHNLKDEK
jgi:glycosyltransferase involved in cell wall biosynthesis